LGLFRGASEALSDFPKSLAQGLDEQGVLAPEMPVESAMGETSVSHYDGNSGAAETFGADAPGGVGHDLLTGLCFVFRPVSHDTLKMLTIISRCKYSADRWGGEEI